MQGKKILIHTHKRIVHSGISFDISVVQALEMIHNIRDAFNELLEKIDWMDDKTRQVARAKAAAIAEKIGYPEYIVNDTAINLDYEGVRTNDTII